MKHSAIIILIGSIGLVFLAGCQKEREPSPNQPQALIPIFEKGDTVRSNMNTSYEETNIVIDSSTQIGFKLTSTHGVKPNEWSAYFFRIEFDFEENIRFLDSLAYGGYVFAGPLLSTFDYGDTINIVAIDNQAVFDWYPLNEVQINNTGWLKYHIYSVGNSPIQNIKIGENYFVFKFGAAANERIGWLNIVYQDSVCYVKEGYYESTANQGIVVGIK